MALTPATSPVWLHICWWRTWLLLARLDFDHSVEHAAGSDQPAVGYDWVNSLGATEIWTGSRIWISTTRNSTFHPRISVGAPKNWSQ
jgi:hypothetical protein